MPVPVAAVDEDGPALRAVGHVGRTREISVRQPVAQSKSGEAPPNYEFGLGAVLADARHAHRGRAVEDHAMAIDHARDTIP